MKLLAVVVGEGYLRDEVSIELETGLADIMPVISCPSATQALNHLASFPDEDEIVVPVLAITPIATSVDSTINELRSHPALAQTHVLLITDTDVVTDIAQVMDSGAIHAVYTDPWRLGALASQARSITVEFLAQHFPDSELTTSLLSTSYQLVERRTSRLLRFADMDEELVFARMIKGIEEVLGPRPRIVLPAGTRLTRQGESTQSIFLATKGRVALERETPWGTITMHHASTGRLVGLLSFGEKRVAFFTSRATTEVEGMLLTLEQLDRVITEEPMVSAALAGLAIRSLNRRLRRAEQIQVEKIELNAQLEAERQVLQETLNELQNTREELVARERFATLGELSAGVAHELNNPVAAMKRAIEHLEEDVRELGKSHVQGDFVDAAFARSHQRTALSTREERQLRKVLNNTLSTSLNSEAAQKMAYALVSAGISHPEEVLSSNGQVLSNEDLKILLNAAGAGSSLRNLEMAANRIQRIVQSLKAYARPDEQSVDGIDINQSLEDTLRLTKHRLANIEVETNYGQLEPVRCYPGQLDQVWTNILVNSADALAGTGRVEITTDMPTPTQVRVVIADNGEKGIAPDVLPRIFEPRFTTKYGRVAFGLGMGISMVKAIIERHGGTIEMTSRPGRTESTVILPIDGGQTLSSAPSNEVNLKNDRTIEKEIHP